MELIYLLPALRIVLGVLFIVPAVLKFSNLKGFSVIIASYNLLPRALVKPLAYAQPFIELFIGAWILWGKQLIYPAIAGLGMMIVADIFVIKAFFGKKKMKNCGCYGADIKIPLTWKKVVENLFWTALFILLILAVNQSATYGIM